jgi:hypothetical protein
MIKYLVIFFSLIPCFLFSQIATSPLDQGQDLNVLYRNEATGSVFAHTRGWGIQYARLKHVTGTRKRILEFSVANMKHPKEYKLKYEGISGNKSFYYGKLNSLMMLRTGVGIQRTLYERSERKSLEIRMSTILGCNFTLIKPVYLYVFKENLIAPIIERYNPDEHNLSNIAGRAPILFGFSNLTVRPGGYAKLGFSFEYGEYSNEVKAIETGVLVDVFPLQVATMAKIPKEQIFVTLYLSFVFGKKWF